MEPAFELSTPFPPAGDGLEVAMTPISQDKNDTKLLLAVAAVVVAGATGLAIVASLGVDRDEPGNAGRAARAGERALTAMPAIERRSPADDDVIELASLEKIPGTVGPFDEVAAEAFRIDPGADYVAEGMRAYRSRDFPIAVVYFTAETEARQERAWTHYMLGLSRWKSGDLAGAVLAMERAGELDAGSIKARINLSRIRNDAGEFEAAAAAAAAAVALDDSDAESHFLLGRSLGNLKRTDESVAALRRSVELDPDHGHVRNLLGLTLLEQGLDDGAVEQLERAVELIPGVAYVHNNLGMALELGGRRDEAVARYRRAQELDPSHRRSAANLARLEVQEPTLEPDPVLADASTAL